MSTPDSRIRIVVVDDADVIAAAVTTLLSTVDAFDVVGTASRGEQALTVIDELQPDLAVVDVDMPEMDGIELTRRIVAAHPGCRVLLLTSLEGSGYLHRALNAGASGYALKTSTADRLFDAIRTVAAGGVVVDPEMATAALRLGPSPLTQREADVLRRYGTGMPTPNVAAELCLSKGTVRNYLSSAMTKLDAENRTEAYLTATRHGWL
ncbi:response regulator transcription factor [Cellulomonas taurus]|uniref:response regulator transcription factor n=1 Tax=Cellulomonas taurus TaxID=2729175 RepID=UPI00145EF85C|nr:response regulator transcription factor [Cellulomonas taurus]